MIDNEDKSYWCHLGEQAEQRFAAPLIGGCSVFINPAKAENKFTHDFFIVMPCDLKTIRTRFNTADRYGIDSKQPLRSTKKTSTDTLKNTRTSLSSWTLTTVISKPSGTQVCLN